ncbi:pentatricopeptide repeat-containing protein At5g27110-like [Chenopodium quinoa]|uniref:Pentatricopeptide repeat-containing protein n=1 Tax=Chenopodium quinoa TaxID=63459 RepID=A0A803L3Y0_CHEQI|nr:pentatricopeptide repeat-containing protein At5g27110-like [Chenopodium quinoa]
MFNHARFLPVISPFFNPKPLSFSLFSTYATKALQPSQPHFLSPNSIDFLPLLSSLQSLHQTKQSHALALVFGFLPSSVSLCASLILNYAKFGSPVSCKFLFENSVFYCKTPFLWNTLLRGYSIARVYDVFHVYNHMIRIGIRPDDHTFPSVIKACADHCESQKGREIHGFSIKVGFDKLVYVGNTLLIFYSSCCDLRDAQNVFDEMPEKDVVSWNSMIGVFSDNGWSKEAVEVFLEMKIWSGFLPNAVSVVSVLPACAALKDEVVPRVIHGYVVKVGLICQVRVGNALVDGYGKCGESDSSRQVFDEIVEKNGVSWNTIITSFAHARCYSDALYMFRLMINSKEKPSGVTLSSLLPVLVELEYFDAGKEVHGLIIRMGFDSDLFISNSLIDMYAKAGDSTKASSVFERMKVKNVVTWNAMVANFAQNNHELAALELVRRMQAFGETPNDVTFTNILPACARIGALPSGKEIHANCLRKGVAPDNFLSNGLIDMYAKCGFVDLAQNVFDISTRDQISYNTLIVGYSQTTECLKSLSLFEEMGSMGMKRDTISFVGAISACANSAALKSGKEIHAFIIRRLFHTHHFITNSLLDLYMKCGKIGIAQNIFEQAHKKDAASWNTMILGYGMLGKFETAVSLFEAMREDTVKHDSISFIAVLSACSHGGLVNEGKKYFEEMKAKGITPKNMHYTCMIDLLGRAGLMEEAVEVIRELPFEPDANIWGALLGATRIHGDIELAKWATEHLFVLKPDHSGYYVLLSNMLAEAGRWDEATRVRELMLSRGVKKDPAYSWVQNCDQVCAFLVGEL